MKLCDRCRVSGCCLNYLGDACKRARKRECPDVVCTHADQIRSMSDEELAEWLNYYAHDGYINPNCGWFEWLKQPAEED